MDPKNRNRLNQVFRSLSRMMRRIAAPFLAAQSNLRRLTRWIKEIVAISIAARLITYSAMFLSWVSKPLAERIVDPFLCPWYSNPMKLKWFIYYCSQDLAWVFSSYAFCKCAVRLSDYLFLVSIILLGYQLIDAFMLFWNFKQSNLIYLDLMWTVLAFISSVFKGYKPETVARVKSLF